MVAAASVPRRFELPTLRRKMKKMHCFLQSSFTGILINFEIGMA